MKKYSNGTPYLKRIIGVFFCLIAFWGSKSFSLSIGVHPNSLPANADFLGPQPIIFTPLDSAAALNAASLPSPEADIFAEERKKGLGPKIESSDRNSSITTLKIALSPKQGTAPQKLYAGAASVSKTFGVGMGYFGIFDTTKTLNGGFAGLGFKWKTLRLGVGYRSKDITDQSRGEVDISFLFLGLKEIRVQSGFDTGTSASTSTSIRKGFSFGGILRNINSNPRLDLGFGYVSSRVFNMEFNINTPASNQISKGDYVLIAATNFSLPPKITAHFQVNYHTKTSKPEPLVAVSYWFTPFASTLIQYTHPNIWTLGLSVMF